MDNCFVSPTNINYSDRAVHYGDGCFTTILVENGQPRFVDRHIHRLEKACLKLNIAFKQSESLKTRLLSESNAVTKGVVKIVISRGTGGRGYSPEDAGPTKIYISHHSYPAHYTKWQERGIRTAISDVKLGKQPLLAGIKHLNRLEQVLIKASPKALEFDDLVVCDIDNNMVETSAGNLFWLKRGKWFTPVLENAGVEGVMRNYIIERIGTLYGYSVQEVCESLNTLQEAEAVFVCNSLMKIVPVRSFQSENQIIQFKTENVHALSASVFGV